MKYFRPKDKVGVWSFGSVVNQGSIRPYTDGSALTRSFERLGGQVGGSTHLYETIYRAVSALRRQWKPRTINALVVLTDGKDDGSTLGGEALTEELLNHKLGPKEPDKPIYVLFTAAYDSPPCRFFFKAVDAFDHECFQVNEANDVNTAYTQIQQRLDVLARRSTGPR